MYGSNRLCIKTNDSEDNKEGEEERCACAL